MTLNDQIMKLQTYKMFEGEDTVYVERDNVLKLLAQEPFMNKPCVAHQVCHEDKVKVLDKIRAEIMQVADQEKLHDEKWALGLRYAVKIIDKYRESEVQK